MLKKKCCNNFDRGIWNCPGWMPPLLVSCARPEIVGGLLDVEPEF
ncbi:MAG: hypothetical protein V2J08_01015 [Desulfotignum sp.]|nr:hypothetical protein [Desulfotignum sp.]